MISRERQERHWLIMEKFLEPIPESNLFGRLVIVAVGLLAVLVISIAGCAS